MPTPLDNLLLQLNRRNIVDWVPEMKLGRPAYDHIRKAIEGGGFSINQMRNGLHALFRLRDHATWQEVFDIFVRFSTHENQKVRSEAVKLRERVLALPDPHPSEMFKHVYPNGSPEVDEQAARFAEYHASFEGAH